MMSELDEAQAEYDAARSEYRAALERVAAAKTRLARAEYEAFPWRYGPLPDKPEGRRRTVYCEDAGGEYVLRWEEYEWDGGANLVRVPGRWLTPEDEPRTPTRWRYPSGKVPAKDC